MSVSSKEVKECSRIYTRERKWYTRAGTQPLPNKYSRAFYSAFYSLSCLGILEDLGGGNLGRLEIEPTEYPPNNKFTRHPDSV